MRILAIERITILTVMFFCLFIASCGINTGTVRSNATLRKKHNVSSSFKKSKGQKIDLQKAKRRLKRFNKTQISASPSTQADHLIEEAKSYLGTPYRYGGDSRAGIDCSAFIINVFEPYEVVLPRISAEQAREGVFVPKNRVQKGDLLFFATGRSRKKINHVGIVVDVGNNDISFIHASSSGGVIVSRLEELYWKRRFITARRVLAEEPIELTRSSPPARKSAFSSQEDAIFDQ